MNGGTNDATPLTTKTLSITKHPGVILRDFSPEGSCAHCHSRREGHMRCAPDPFDFAQGRLFASSGCPHHEEIRFPSCPSWSAISQTDPLTASMTRPVLLRPSA